MFEKGVRALRVLNAMNHVDASVDISKRMMIISASTEKKN